ncbi:hypothetical protein M514_19888 [Trichuris suis]|uniref:DDE-1 domain-containing protein n=1 Tax=Trichuris suis TaxID=68888 RepID=A0A085NEW5_9BILA|nr:hypothetical protein M514_19888 [Trichuris suis]
MNAVQALANGIKGGKRIRQVPATFPQRKKHQSTLQVLSEDQVASQDPTGACHASSPCWRIKDQSALTKPSCAIWGPWRVQGGPASNGWFEWFDENATLRVNLKKFKNDIAYLTELYSKFNETNLQLQGDNLSLIKTKAIVSAFVSKLVIFKRNLGRGGFCFGILCVTPYDGITRQMETEVTKRKSSTVDSSKGKRKAITLEQKVDVIKKHARSDSKAKITIWIGDCNQERIPLEKAAIQAKAKNLLSAVQAKIGEVDGGDNKAAAQFPANLRGIIEEEGYTGRQIFNVDETALLWKRMPTRTYLSVDERIQPGYSISKERFTLLLGGNAEEDFKLKPMLVYKSLMPRAVKGYREKSLPVIWRANRNAWVTKVLFEDWFLEYLCPAVERYCKQSNLAFKALLILDDASSHSITLGQLNESVQAWQKVSGSIMCSAWKFLLPDQEDCCRRECAQVDGIIKEITKVGLSKLSLENLNAEVVKEVLESKLEALTNEDLLNCDVQNAGIDGSEEEDEEDSSCGRLKRFLLRNWENCFLLPKL